MEKQITIVGIAGSLATTSRSLAAINIALQGAAETGAGRGMEEGHERPAVPRKHLADVRTQRVGMGCDALQSCQRHRSQRYDNCRVYDFDLCPEPR